MGLIDRFATSESPHRNGHPKGRKIRVRRNCRGIEKRVARGDDTAQDHVRVLFDAYPAP
jgi:hypothetical protein